MKVAVVAGVLTASLAFRVTRKSPADAPDGSVEVGGRAAATRNETGTLEGPVPQCSCLGTGTNPVFHYQTWPLIDGGIGCIGGCGGTDAWVNHYGGTVKTLTVWRSSWWNDLGAIQVTYHDGHVATFGDPSGGVDAASFTFYPGEYLVGDFRLSSSWNGGRATFMGFETSMGRGFQSGSPDLYQFRFPTGGAYLAGFAGAVGGEIHRLGALFWKPIASIEYIDLNYPTLPIPVGSPTVINSRQYCNLADTPFPSAERKFSRAIIRGESSCLTSTVGGQFGANIGISGPIPKVLVVNGSAGAEFGVSGSVSTTNCQNSTTTTNETLRFPSLDIPPRYRIDYVFSQWQGTLNHLPFTATLRIRLNDGTEFTRTESGTYSGVSYTNIREAYVNPQNNPANCD